MKAKSIEIIKYLTNSLSQTKANEVIHKIATDEEYAMDVLRIKNMFENENDRDATNYINLLFNYIEGKMDPEAEIEFEKLLQATGDWNFFQDIIKNNLVLQFTIDENGTLRYSGNELPYIEMVGKINSGLPEDLMMLCEHAITMRGDSLLDIKSPENGELIFSDTVEFSFQPPKVGAIPTGWSIKIINSLSIEIHQLNIQSVNLHITLDEPGRYFWKLIDSDNTMRDTRNFILVFKK